MTIEQVKPRFLTPEQKEHFLEHGWIKIEKAFLPCQASIIKENMWTRLGMSPTDQDTWTEGRVFLPATVVHDVADSSPKAWAAIQELMQGDDALRELKPISHEWADNFIVNLGKKSEEGDESMSLASTRGATRDWHIDGDTYIHYLDSCEQGLLIIPCWTDVVPGGGATLLCPKAIDIVAKHLYDHPEGVDGHMVPRGRPDFLRDATNCQWGDDTAARMAHHEMVEATGEVGDVFLLHPFMLHSSSANTLRRVRVITNPKARVEQPYCYSRAGGSPYSLVEQKTRLALMGQGVTEEELGAWHITEPREDVVPPRLRKK